jgi:aldehyde dehydrogenase (NAD+)
MINFDDAIAMNNAASHGLSSSVFTQDLREAEIFTSSIGSDCGIANVNIGTSGAENWWGVWWRKRNWRWT